MQLKTYEMGLQWFAPLTSQLCPLLLRGPTQLLCPPILSWWRAEWKEEVLWWLGGQKTEGKSRTREGSGIHAKTGRSEGQLPAEGCQVEVRRGFVPVRGSHISGGPTGYHQPRLANACFHQDAVEIHTLAPCQPTAPGNPSSVF